VAPVEYSGAIIDLLVDLGWLDLAQSEDRAQIGAAISRMIADAAAHKR
jgi:hypothetical protein